MYWYVLAMVMVSLTAGCVGSSSRAPTMGPMPMSDAAARAKYDRILANANLELSGAIVGYRQRGNKLYLFRKPGTCEGEACAEGYTLEDTSLQILGVNRGVSRVNESRHDAERRLRVYGGWMEDSFFAIQSDQFLDRHSGRYRGLYGLTTVFSYVVGYSPGTNPDIGSVSGRWNGLMLGVDVGAWPNRGDALSGDATVVVELAGVGMQADVSITNIVDHLDAPRTDMTWEDLNVESGRFGHDDGLTDNLAGAFFGAGHGEVAGKFHRDLIIGTFGGVRE